MKILAYQFKLALPGYHAIYLNFDKCFSFSATLNQTPILFSETPGIYLASPQGQKRQTAYSSYFGPVLPNPSSQLSVREEIEVSRENSRLSASTHFT